jgi:glycosyltransferase involved in cell wall biosynthesis
MNNDLTYSKLSLAILTPNANYYGGVEYVNHMLIKLFEKEGFDTRIISQELLQKEPLLKVRKRLFGLNRLLSRHFSRHYTAQTDVVICNGEFSLGICHPAAINSFHGCYFGYAQAMRLHVPKREFRGLMRKADEQKIGAEGKYVIADSRTLAEILETQGIKVDAVIDNAIDTELFKPIKSISRNDRCLFVGSLDHYGKGFDILEKLADKGIGIDCVTSSRPRDTRLGWLGNVPNEVLPGYYARYKFFLLPSRFEGCGLVALEAMACGTPIVMTAVGAGPDIAREIPDFVVDGAWDEIPQKIADRLNAIENNYEDLAFRAREYVVRHHNYDDWKRKWLNTVDLVYKQPGRLIR